MMHSKAFSYIGFFACPTHFSISMLRISFWHGTSSEAWILSRNAKKHVRAFSRAPGLVSFR